MPKPRTGTIRERSPGVWEVRVYVGKNPHTGAPIQKSKTVHGDKAAAEAAVERLREQVEGQHAELADIRTVRQLAAAWLRHLEGIGRAANTIEGYEKNLRLYIFPALGTKPLADLSALHLDRLYGELHRKGLTRSIPYVHATVRAMLTQAVKWDLVERNVAQRATLPTVPPVAPWAPPEDTVRAFLHAVAETNPDMGAYLLLTADLGARRSEPLALRWTDIDPERGEVNVSRTLEHTAGQRKAGQGPREKPTKTHATGTIPVSPDTLAALEGVRERQREDAAKIGVLVPSNGFVFADLASGPGEPWRPDRVTRAVRRYRKRPDLAHLPEVEKITVKSLRHFMVTSLAARGMMVEAMKRARHRSITTTQRYTAAVEARQRASADVMADVLAFKRPEASEASQ